MRPSSVLWPLGISVAGLLLLVPLTFGYSGAHIAFQSQVVGGVFTLICSFGAIMGVFPSKVLALLGRKQMKTDRIDSYMSTRSEGHHPPCGKFSTHIISVAGRAICAGCTGLVLGALISITGSLVYFFIGLSIGNSYIIFWFGFFFVLLGLFQYKIDLDDPFIHVILNVVFVIGAFLLVVGVDRINGSLLVQSYLLAITVYWIMTRIVLSEADHMLICRRCEQESCPYSFTT